MCAQVCHKGHDVGYSRKSSFYCDCGAPGESDCQRVPCKCLSAVSDDILATFVDGASQEKELNSLNPNIKYYQFWKEASEMLSTIIPDIFHSSLERFAAAVNPSIFQRLFEMFNENFEALKEREKMGIDNLDTSNVLREGFIIDDKCNDILLTRNQRLVPLTSLEDELFSCIRTFKAASICTRISNETSTDRLKKSVLTKNGIERKIVVADRRGRLIIYEPTALVFCAGVCLANARNNPTSRKTHLSRSDLCVLGSSQIKCNVVGLCLHPEDDTRLAAWGVSDAFVYFISESGDKVETAIELELSLDVYDAETDYIIKIEWLLGSSVSSTKHFSGFDKLVP